MAQDRPRWTLPLLFSVVVVDLIGFGIVIPVLPFYADALGASATQLGFLFTAYAGAQFLAAPLWGRLSDRVGRRPVLLLTIAGTSLGLLWVGLASSLLGLFLGRLVGGGFAANIGVASAYLSDVTDEDERTRWMGALGACFGVGFVLGPAIGGLLSVYGYAVPLLFAAGLAAVNLVYAALVLREAPRHASSAAPAPRSRAAALRDPAVLRICLLYLAFSVAVAQLETIFPYFMKDRFGYDAQQVAWILVGIAVVMGGIQGGGMKALSRRFREPVLVGAGSLLAAVSMGLVPSMATVAILLVPLAGAAIGRAVAQPSLMSMASMTAAPEGRGAVMGAFQSSASLGRVVGPLLAGMLYDASLPAPFWLAAVLMLVVALRGRLLPSREPSELPREGNLPLP